MDGSRKTASDINSIPEAFPVVIRVRNRPVFLAATLDSLCASGYSLDDIVVFDDHSDDPDMIKYLTTDKEFELKRPCVWPKDDEWLEQVGWFQDTHALQGIWRSWYDSWGPEVFRAKKHLGAARSVFASVAYAMEKWKGEDAILHIEGDVMFCGDWIDRIWSAYKEARAYGGKRLGVLGCFDPWGTIRLHIPSRPDWGWMSGGKTWTSQMLVFTREFYDACRPAFEQEYLPREKSADHKVSDAVINGGFYRAKTKQSFCQHIGFQSTCWKHKRLLAVKPASPRLRFSNVAEVPPGERKGATNLVAVGLG